jgi:2-dehydro-3-deoxyphosphogalactonate aldolase
MARCSAKVSVMPHELLARMPIVAVLRGVTPERAADIGRIVFEAGIFAIEVPLNSPQPFDSIARLSAALRGFCLCGAGTVLDPADVRRAYDAGARLIVSPNTNPDVIAAALERSMTVMPGFATATEAFRGIQAGATDLKLFPAASYGPGHLKALKAVLPKSVQVYAVGGVGADHVGEWVAAGATGFGFGSELFKPDYSAKDIELRARRLVEAVQRATQEK